MSDYEPKTIWAQQAQEIEARIAQLYASIAEMERQRRDALRLRCPHRDSGGARCTDDVDHVMKGVPQHRWEPLADWPEPIDPASWPGAYGSNWRSLDRWDLWGEWEKRA